MEKVCLRRKVFSFLHPKNQFNSPNSFTEEESIHTKRFHTAFTPIQGNLSLTCLRRLKMQHSLTFLLVLSVMSSWMPEDTHVSTELHTREVVLEGKILNETWENKESKHDYKVQFKERGFYQVEHVFSETEYGSSKETQIYFVDGENMYLVARKEFTRENIVPSKFDGNYLKRVEEFPFSTSE
jgi:hypothetical protein